MPDNEVDHAAISNVHVLHARQAPLASFIRVGHTGHHKLEALLAADRFPYRRVVFDAAHAARQVSLREALKSRGCEIVLDLNFAETAAPGRYKSAVSRLHWGNAERAWEPSDFEQCQSSDLYKTMADFGVEFGADVVLAPSHLSEGPLHPWHSIDLAGCQRLRAELDRSGGQDVGIDYQLITSMAALKDPGQRGLMTEGIADLPFQNLWLRASGFGANATGAGVRQFIEVTRSFHDVGHPVVVDMAGGFAGLSTLAFGAAGGLSHGVAMNESFDGNDWRRPPKGGQGGGLGQRAYVPDLDRHLTDKQLEAFFAVRGTKSRFGCIDTSCCPGIDDILGSSHAHFVTQRSRQVADIDAIPEARRAEHFLLRVLDPAVRSTRQAAKLTFADECVQKLVERAKSRLVRFRDALGALNEADAGAETISRSRAPAFRGCPRGGRGVAMLGARP